MTLNIELLESSFSQIKDQEIEFTTHFYRILFADSPAVKPLFADTHMEKQARQLFKSLVFVVDNLRCPGVLSDSLKGLGTRHVRYGVLPEHYPMVGSALLKALSICLRNAWTTTTEQAWSDAYTVVTQLMLSGADYPREILTARAQQDLDSHQGTTLIG
jgi:hemoglobin-like flavoprotein